MQTLTARYRVVTPLFMGAPETPEKAELNLRGIKGAVRFWWRALNYATCPDISKLRAREAALFGAAAEKEKKEGASRFKWRVAWDGGEPKRQSSKLPGADDKQGIAYLAGQGLAHSGTRAGRLKRECFWNGDGHAMVLKLELRSPAKWPFCESGRWTPEGAALRDALHLLGLLGGIGSRKSRGFGSLSLEKLELADIPTAAIVGPADIEEYQSQLGQLLPALGANASAPLPEFPYFSPRSQIWLVARETCTDVDILQDGKPSIPFEVSNRALALLDYIGKQMIRYRSFGSSERGGTTLLGEIAEKNFLVDHDWAKSPHRADLKDKHPRRIAFGMPLGYTSRPVTSVRPNGWERRGSPLVLHVHSLGDGKHVAVATMIPAKLVADGAVEYILNRDAKHPIKQSLMANFEQRDAWSDLAGFITGKIGPRDNKYEPPIPYFDTQREIWPAKP